MSDNEKLIKEARAFADRDNGLNWQGRIRELADALEAAERVHALQREPSDGALDAAFDAFRAHDRGEEFNEFGEHVCSECGYAYSWPAGAHGRQDVPWRRRQRHLAREALRASGITK